MEFENVIYQELIFKLNTHFSIYEEYLNPHSIKPNSYYELKYNMYISLDPDYKSAFGLLFNRKPLLFFKNEHLDAVYYRFNGNQTTYLKDTIEQLICSKVGNIHKNTISFELKKDFYIKIMYREETDNTGMSFCNSSYYMDGLKSIEEKKKELSNFK